MRHGIAFGNSSAFRQHFLIMLKNNIILAFRHLTRQRIYSAINLIGLSLGMASFLIIVLFYQFQMSYDQFHTKKEQVYRVNKFMNERWRFSNVSPTVGESIPGNVSGVEKVVRLANITDELHYGDKQFSEHSMYATDASFFKVFDFELLSGDPTTCLSELNSIVLSESLVTKYFGNASPMDKIISTTNRKGQKIDVKVTGIMKDIPANSHLMINALFSYPTIKNFYTSKELDANWNLCRTYLLLDGNANPKEVEKQVTDLLSPQIPIDDLNFKTASLELQPLTEIYFNPSKNGGSQMGNEGLTNIFLMIGICILLIASMNYINLATARSINRSKEVGIRKVSGANKKQLVYQFLGESVFFCLASMILAIILVNLFIPVINDFSNYAYKIDLNPYFFLDPKFLMIALLAAISTGLISGLYPAFVISAFQPSKSLKGDTIGRGKLSAKKTLVIVQYVVSIFLVICCITIYKVFDHTKNQNFGFENENILALKINKIPSQAKVNDLKNEIRKLNGVKEVAATSKIPLTHRDENSSWVYDSKINMNRDNPLVYVDEDYFKLLDEENGIIEMAHLKSDQLKDGIFVNEKFMTVYGDQYALGNALDVYANKTGDQVMFTSNINGVVRNYKDRMLQPKLDPQIFKISNDNFNYLLIRLLPEGQHETITSIEASFKNLVPHLAFEFSFIEDEMNLLFSMISPFSTLIYYATFFAIIIASMGLFALSLFITQQRTKEIGIRKIFGSSELKISFLLAGQFVKLIVISFLIAAPLTFYGFRWILMKFPDKIVLNWSLLIGTGMGFILVALLTVIGQAWKAARTNPVDTLRYE